MWFECMGRTSVEQHYKKAGVDAVTDGRDALMLDDSRVRDAKKAAFDPVRKLEKGLNLGIGGVLTGGYLSDTEHRQPQTP